MVMAKDMAKADANFYHCLRSLEFTCGNVPVRREPCLAI